MRLIDDQGKLLGRVNLIDGAAIFFGLFFAALLLHFSYHNLLRHTTLTLEEATPKVFVPGVDRLLSIRGNGFKENLRVYVSGRPPLEMYLVNEARWDLQLPDDLGPGNHRVMVRNPGGRMLIRDDLFQIRWEPVVRTIVLESEGYPFLYEASYRITGKYLEPGCAITVDGAPVLRPSWLNPQEVLITVPGTSNKVWTELSIQNPSGGGIVLKGEELLKRTNPDHFRSAATPRISQVIPKMIPARQATVVVVIGYDLQKGCSIRIGTQLLQNLEWVPPHVVAGFLPATPRIPGAYEVEATNPNGMKTAYVNKVVVPDEGRVDKGLVEVELGFEPLSREELRNLLRFEREGWIAEDPDWAFQILEVVNRKKNRHAKVRLRVEVRGTGKGSSALYYYQDRPLQIGSPIPLRFSRGRVVSTRVRSVPNRVEEGT